MDSGTLRLFRAVAETGSVSRAAERMNCVQSNVTTRLRRLEDELGVLLFTRTPRAMVPTAAGQVLAGYADRILALLDEATRAVAAVGEGVGPLALGSMETTAAVRLPAVLARYHRDFPGVEITLSTGDTEQLLEGVLARRFDAALVGAVVDHPELTTRAMFVEELVLVSGAALGESPAGPMLLCFRRGCAYRTVAESWWRERGHLPVRMMEFGTLDGILGCVAAGMGCAVLPRSVVERPHYAGQFSIDPLPPAIGLIPTRLVWRRDAPANPRLDAFVGVLEQMQGAVPLPPQSTDCKSHSGATPLAR